MDTEANAMEFLGVLAPFKFDKVFKGFRFEQVQLIGGLAGLH